MYTLQVEKAVLEMATSVWSDDPTSSSIYDSKLRINRAIVRLILEMIS